MKKELRVAAALLVVLGLVLALVAACSQPAPAPKPSPSPAPAPGASPAPAPTVPPKPTTAVKPTVLKVQSHGGATNAYRIGVERIMKKVEDRAGGRIKFDYYPGDALAEYKEVFAAVASGVLDIGHTATNYHLGEIGAPAVFNHMPWNFTPSRFMENYRKVGYYDYMNQRYEKNGTMLLTIYYQPSGDFEWSKKKPVKKMEDLKGLIVATNIGMFDFFKMLGARPVELSSPERYDAMARGTVDVINMGASIAVSSRYWEVSQGLTVINTAAGTNMHIMNLETLKKLPADLQKLFLDAALESEKEHAADTEKATKSDIDTCAKNGMETYIVPPAEREEWIKATMASYDGIKQKSPKDWEEFTTKYWPSLR